MQLTLIDWGIIVVYFALIAAVGCLCMGRAGRSLEEFFVSGRSLPWWISGTSMIATSFAADTPLAVVSLTAKNGLAGNWFWWAFALGGMFTVFVFAKLWRRSEVITDVELISIRYSGKPARGLRYLRALYVALIVNPIIVGWVVGAMLTVLDQTVLATSEGVANQSASQAWWIVAAMLLFVGLYSTLSGMWGVALTDLVQFCIAMSGCIWLAVVAVDHVGGPAQLQQKVIENFGASGEQAFAFLPDFTGDNAWMPLHIFLIMLGIQWWATWYPGAEPGGGGYVVQRMASSKNERHAVLATLWYQIGHYCIRPWPWLMVAFAALAMYPELRSLPDPGVGFPMVMRDLCPPGLRGLMLVAFFAAFMSTISTQMNWGASYLVRDFIQPLIAPQADERQLTRYSRIVSVLVLVVGSGVAWLMKQRGMSVDDAWKMLAALGAGSGAVYMLRWFWWRINASSEIVAMFASLAYYLFFTSSWFSHQFIGQDKWITTSLRDEEIMTIVALCTMVTWLVATLVTRPERHETLVAFYRKIHPSRMGWRPIAQLAPDVVPDSDLGLRVFGAFLASGIVYSTLPGIGYLIFGKTLAAIVCFFIAGLCAVGVSSVIGRMFPWVAPVQSPNLTDAND